MFRPAKKFLIFVVVILCSCTTIKEPEIRVIDESRLKVVEIDNNNKLVTLDTYETSVKNIFKELLDNNFKLYNISCYAPRNIRGGSTRVSIHAYASAIDVNPQQNPYIDMCSHVIIPTPPDRKHSDCEDFYSNRNFIRDGMLTQREADIFAKNGFTVWGGLWRRPIDYMHFQTTRAIAKIVTTLPSNEASQFWTHYLQNPQLIAKDEFFSDDIAYEDIVLTKLLDKIEKILHKK